MPLFGLTPVPQSHQAEAWSASTYRGPCYVMAADERRARLYAANHFARPDTARTPSGLQLESPWVMPKVVATHVTFFHIDRAAPDGTVVLAPEEPNAMVIDLSERRRTRLA